MTELPKTINEIDTTIDHEKIGFVADMQEKIEEAGYKVEEVDDARPWGAFIRISNDQADDFVADFFDGLTPEEARLGNPEAELSPKILIVTPGQRLSLQRHGRRAERWKFLTPGGYYKSESDDGGELQQANPGDVVQFKAGEVHRLCGVESGFVVVAEIWQHTNPNDLSNEDDIVRLQDDYKR